MLFVPQCRHGLVVEKIIDPAVSQGYLHGVDLLLQTVRSGGFQQRAGIHAGRFFQQDAAGALLQAGGKGIGTCINRIHPESRILPECGFEGDLEGSGR